MVVRAVCWWWYRLTDLSLSLSSGTCERSRRAPAQVWPVPARKHNAHLSDTPSSQTAGGEISARQYTNQGKTGTQATSGYLVRSYIFNTEL